MPFAKNLRTLRLARGLTQQELADLTNVTAFQIRRYEGRGVEPKLAALRSLVIALQCDAEALLFDSASDNADNAWQRQLAAIETLPETAQTHIKTTLAALIAWYQ